MYDQYDEHYKNSFKNFFQTMQINKKNVNKTIKMRWREYIILGKDKTQR